MARWGDYLFAGFLMFFSYLGVYWDKFGGGVKIIIPLLAFIAGVAVMRSSDKEDKA